jgi:hypothetical protein
MSTDVAQKVERVNALLLAGEPGNVTTDEHAGYTGYKPQAIVDAMNEGFGIGEWGFEEVSSEIVPGDKGALAIAQVSVWLKGIDFKPTSWGQNRVTRGDIGDAKKGAQTDAIKKGLSYFSIGNRAYHGLLKEGNKLVPTARPIRPVAQPTITMTDEHMLPAQATSAINAPVPGKLRKMFAEIGTTLETAQKMTFKQIFPDDNLTPEQCFVLRQVYDAWKIKYDEKAKAS